MNTGTLRRQIRCYLLDSMKGHTNNKQHLVSLQNQQQSSPERLFCLLQPWNPIMLCCSLMVLLELLQVAVLLLREILMKLLQRCADIQHRKRYIC
jgi:hypothetical protein